MKNFLISTLLLIFIIGGISCSFYFNFSSDLLIIEPINIFISIIYVLAWIGLTYLEIKKDFLIINVFRFLLWTLSLVSSIIDLTIALEKPIPTILEAFSVSNLIINRVILKGISFADSLIGNNIIFIIVAVFFLFTPIVYKLTSKIISLKIDKPSDTVGQV